jgi:hypothetical protein
MLDVLSVLCHDCRAKFGKASPELWQDLGAHQVLDRLLAAVIRVDVYLKLENC